MSGWWVYILRCGDGTLYTGMTDDPERRLAAHRSGHGAKYTRGRGPLELVYSEACGTRGDALRREAAIKRLPRAKKLRLVEKKEVLRREMSQDYFVFECRGADSRARRRTGARNRLSAKRGTPKVCHCEERSDVAISGRHCRFGKAIVKMARANCVCSGGQ